MFDRLDLCERVLINTNSLSHKNMWVGISPDQFQTCFNIVLRRKLWKGRHTWLKHFWAQPLNITIDAAHCQHLVLCIGRQREGNQESSNILIHQEVNANQRNEFSESEGWILCYWLTFSLKTKAHLCLPLHKFLSKWKLGFMWVKVPHYINIFSWALLVSSSFTICICMYARLSSQISLSFPSFRFSEIILWPEQREGGSAAAPPTREMPWLNLLACISPFLHLFCHFSDTRNTHLYIIHALDMAFFTSLKLPWAIATMAQIFNSAQ